MNYEQSLDYIYHAKQSGAEKHGLANITELLKRLGNPEACFPSVHIAGTNGKGSTAAMLESILRAAGYRTGLYTSPFLERFPERIRVGGEEIEEGEFAALATEVRSAADGMVRDGHGHPTFFELVTACCFLHFARQSVDIAVVEAGLGGRTDATNVIKPVLSVITTIGIDHAASLGGTLESIAAEKAGILKPGVPAVLAGGSDPAALAVVQCWAKELGIDLRYAGDTCLYAKNQDLDGQAFDLSFNDWKLENLKLKLLGRHQLVNAATAVLAACSVRAAGFVIPEEVIRSGLAQARWPGRMELLRREPPLIIDGAHNPQGAEVLADAVLELLPGRQICLVAGAMADKDVPAMVRQFARFASHAIITLPPSHGRMQKETGAMAAMFSHASVKSEACPDWQKAMALALDRDMAVVVAGSLYLAGAVRTWWSSTARGR